MMLAEKIVDFLSANPKHYHAAWNISEKLGFSAEFIYSEKWEEAIAFLISTNAIEEVPEVQYRYRLKNANH